MTRRPVVAGTPTLESVARHAGVSRQTVSNALHRPDRLAGATRLRVLEAIEELGYRASVPARQLATRRSGAIAVRADRVADGISGGVLDAFLHALAEGGHACGQRVVLYPQLEDPADEALLLADLLAGSAADAVVLTGIEEGDGRARRLQAGGHLFCAFGRPWSAEQHPYDWVDVDGTAGTQLAVKHLLGLGRRRIAYLGLDDHSSTGRDRRTGWERAVRDAGIEAAAPCVAIPNDADAATAATLALFERADPPDGIVCASDTLAFGAHRAATRLVLDVPVVGFDATSLSAALGFASIAQPVRAAAEACLQLLADRLDGRAGPARGLLLSPDLVPPP